MTTVVSLLPPTILIWRKGRLVGPAEESRRANDELEGEHLVLPQDVQHVCQTRDLDIVDYKPSTFTNVRIKIKIFELWEWKSVWSVQEN